MSGWSRRLDSSGLRLESVDRDGCLGEGLDLLVVEGNKRLDSLGLLRLGWNSRWNSLSNWSGSWLDSLSDWSRLGWNSLRLGELEECLLGSRLGWLNSWSGRLRLE